MIVIEERGFEGGGGCGRGGGGRWRVRRGAGERVLMFERVEQERGKDGDQSGQSLGRGWMGGSLA